MALRQNSSRRRKHFGSNLRLASGDSKTRLRLKQLESLILRFALLCLPKYSLIGCSKKFGRKLIHFNVLVKLGVELPE